MSDARLNLDCWWGARLESAGACAEHLADVLTMLAGLHPAFGRWNRKGNTRAAANRSFCSMPPRVEELTRIFEKRLFSPGVPEDGYQLSAWNGRDPPYGSSFGLHAGTASNCPVFPNSFTVEFPQRTPANGDLINAAVLKPALVAAATAWRPDYAGIAPWAYSMRWLRAEPWDDLDREHTRDDGYVPTIRSGWMTYLCADYARRIVRPPGIEVEPVAGGGILLIATREVFTPGNPAHDAAADAIQEALLPLQNLPCEAMRR